MGKILKLSLIIATTFGTSHALHAATYSYELSADQTWGDASTGDTGSTKYVSVRSYVSGADLETHRNVVLYTPTYASEANSLGDVVGSEFNVYGSGTTAFADPYDGPNRTIIYPATQILHTNLMSVNDDRLAIGSYNILGGHAQGNGFIYDLIHDQYTQLNAPSTEWTDLGDINNFGHIVGTSINDGGTTRKGFTYDCQNGFEAFDIPGSSWTVPKKIDNDGNIYGVVSGIAEAAYFIARPDSAISNPTCSLVPRDDVADPIVFDSPASYELSGDAALGVKIADFDGRGVNDLLVYHQPGKTILYLGEDNFDSKIKYYGDEFNTISEGMDIPTEWDFNNDGLIDKVRDNLLYFAKNDGSYYYVLQKLPSGGLNFGDMNGDGLVDYVTFDGGSASIAYQIDQSVVATEPTQPPVTATLSLPIGVSNNNNSFTWNTVTSATDYRLMVVDSTGNRLIDEVYTASLTSCTTGTSCSITPATSLFTGNYWWSIQAKNSIGWGSWSTFIQFTVGSGSVPVAATLGSPTPTYTWNAVTSATDYRLLVVDPNGNRLIDEVHTVSMAGCTTDTSCSITPATSLSAGSYWWSIQTKNSFGWGPWSTFMPFQKTQLQ